MGPRLDLQALLLTFCPKVYYQQPPTIWRNEPCILYKRDWAITNFAGNLPYKHVKRYLVTVIDPDPDSAIPDEIAKLPMCVFDRHFTANDLNHFVYKLFF